VAIDSVVWRQVSARNRVDGLIALLRENAEVINAPDTLKIEIDCGKDRLVFKASRAYHMTATVAITGQNS